MHYRYGQDVRVDTAATFGPYYQIDVYVYASGNTAVTKTLKSPMAGLDLSVGQNARRVLTNFGQLDQGTLGSVYTYVMGIPYVGVSDYYTPIVCEKVASPASTIDDLYVASGSQFVLTSNSTDCTVSRKVYPADVSYRQLARDLKSLLRIHAATLLPY